MATTTYNKPKAFAWSYSKLKNFATCPKRYYEVDVTKHFQEDESDILKWGNQVHAAMAQRLLPSQVTLPVAMEQYEPWALKIESIPGNRLVEQKYAIDELMQPVEWFARDVWFRGIADVLVLATPVAIAIDWKLGKILEDSQQLALMAACVFAHYHDIQAVRTEFVWLKDDATTREDFKRSDLPKIWLNVMPRVKELKHAHETMQFPVKPSRLCRNYCPVSSCEHHGK